MGGGSELLWQWVVWVWVLAFVWVLVLSLNCLTVVGDAIWLIGGGNGLLYGDSTGWFGF